MKKHILITILAFLVATYGWSQIPRDGKLQSENGIAPFQIDMTIEQAAGNMEGELTDFTDEFMGPVKIGLANAAICKKGFCGMPVKQIKLYFLDQPDAAEWGEPTSALYKIVVTVPEGTEFEDVAEAALAEYGNYMPQHELFESWDKSYQWWGNGNVMLNVSNYLQNGEGDMQEGSEHKVWIVLENQM